MWNQLTRGQIPKPSATASGWLLILEKTSPGCFECSVYFTDETFERNPGDVEPTYARKAVCSRRVAPTKTAQDKDCRTARCGSFDDLSRTETQLRSGGLSARGRAATHRHAALGQPQAEDARLRDGRLRPRTFTTSMVARPNCRPDTARFSTKSAAS